MEDLKLVLQRVFPQIPWKFFREHAFYKLSLGDRDTDLSFEIDLEQDVRTGVVFYFPRFNDNWGPKGTPEEAAKWIRTRLDIYCTQRTALLRREIAALKVLSK